MSMYGMVLTVKVNHDWRRYGYKHSQLTMINAWRRVLPLAEDLGNSKYHFKTGEMTPQQKSDLTTSRGIWSLTSREEN